MAFWYSLGPRATTRKALLQVWESSCLMFESSSRRFWDFFLRFHQLILFNMSTFPCVVLMAKDHRSLNKLFANMLFTENKKNNGKCLSDQISTFGCLPVLYLFIGTIFMGKSSCTALERVSRTFVVTFLSSIWCSQLDSSCIYHLF